MKTSEGSGFHSMKKVTIKMLFSIVVLSLVLTGCTGASVATSWPGISENNNKVYVAYGPQVYSVNGDNGSLLWKYPEKASAAISYYAAPSFTEDGQLIICDYKGVISSLNSDTGVANWTFPTKDRVVADPLVVGNTVYVSSADYYVYAIDNTGKEIWKFKTNNHLWSKPVFSNDVIYQSGMDHFLYAISAGNGNLIWSVDMGAAALGSPVIDSKGIIYSGTLGKEIVAINSNSHAIAWKYKTKDSIWSGLVEKDGVLYFGDLSGNFTALDTSTKQPVWEYKAAGAVVSIPLLLEDKIVFTSEDGTLTGLGYDGKAIFTPKLGEKLYAPPVLAGSNILVGITGDKDKKIFSAVDQSGAVAWSFQTPE